MSLVAARRFVSSVLVLAIALVAFAATSMTPVSDAAAAVAFAPIRAADAPDPAHPAPAPGDSTVQRFLDDLSDSTSRYFGRTAAPADTTGLDSILADRLAHPALARTRRPLSVYPDFEFNRVDGPVYTVVANVGGLRGLGQLSGRGSWAAGPGDPLGTVRWTRGFGVGTTAPWRLEIGGGRWTSSFDRESSSRRLTTLRALALGKDHHHYYRREGWYVGLHRDFSFGDLGLTWRDDDQMVQSTTTGWNLFHHGLSEFENLAATPGHVHEFEAITSLALDPFPMRLDLLHQTSGHAIGSELEFRRSRVVLAGSWGLGHFATLVPQAVYGRLTGQDIPQASFYLGGTHSIRSMSSGDRGGTGYAMVRMEVIGARDFLATLRIPHPAYLPLQLGTFAGAGSVWGTDPFGGPTRPGVNFPHEEDWATEAGVSIIYQPGFPDPTTLLRLNYAWALGTARESTHLSISFMRALDLLRRSR
jgi:hypothetical protein